MKNIESFLKKIGVPSSTIAKLAAEDEIDVEPFVNGFKLFLAISGHYNAFLKHNFIRSKHLIFQF